MESQVLGEGAAGSLIGMVPVGGGEGGGEGEMECIPKSFSRQLNVVERIALPTLTPLDHLTEREVPQVPGLKVRFKPAETGGGAAEAAGGASGGQKKKKRKASSSASSSSSSSSSAAASKSVTKEKKKAKKKKKDKA